MAKIQIYKFNTLGSQKYESIRVKIQKSYKNYFKNKPLLCPFRQEQQITCIMAQQLLILTISFAFHDLFTQRSEVTYPILQGMGQYVMHCHSSRLQQWCVIIGCSDFQHRHMETGEESSALCKLQVTGAYTVPFPCSCRLHGRTGS